MRNAKDVSHTAQVRAQFHNDEAAVLFFTNMTLVELTDYKMDTGKAWIVKYCLGRNFTEREANEVWQEPELLQWWHLEWRRMDHYVILPILHKIMESERENVYKDMHIEVFLSKHPGYAQLEVSLGRVLKRKYGDFIGISRVIKEKLL